MGSKGELRDLSSAILPKDSISLLYGLPNFAREERIIYWSLFFLNLACLWSYQSLVTAQNYYSTKFPDIKLSYWGTVAVGTSMFVCHIFQALLQSLTMRTRILTAYVGYIVIGFLVIFWQEAYVILASFALIGALNAMNQGPLYGIASLFPISTFTQAVNAGNGLAGLLNVSAEFLIRLSVSSSKESSKAAELSFKIFIGLMMVLSILGIIVFFNMIRLNTCKTYLVRSENVKSADDEEGMQKESIWAIFVKIWPAALIQFFILFISLLVWPGISCAAPKHDWFDEGGSQWFQAPFIIGAFNVGDFIGRSVAGVEVVCNSFSLKTCGVLTLARMGLALLVVLCVRPQIILSNWILIVIVLVIGVSNGLICTITMMKGPLLVPSYQRGEASYIMVGALFAGISLGSISAVILDAIFKF